MFVLINIQTPDPEMPVVLNGRAVGYYELSVAGNKAKEFSPPRLFCKVKHLLADKIRPFASVRR